MENMTANYIKENWKNTVRHQCNKKGLELPYPYSVPCIEERFTCFFYWDTYFINVGLLYDDLQQVKHNLANMNFFVEKMGYIPNGNEQVMFNRSQPPLYAHGVMDYYQKANDVEIINEHYNALIKEYEFWMQKRMTNIGLNQYAASPTEEEILNFHQELYERGILSFSQKDNKRAILHYFAEAESGWDFSPRFHAKALHFVQVDLNSILLKTELILAEFSKILNKTDNQRRFLSAAERRTQLMNKYLRAENGIYYDYDFIECRRSNMVTGASMLPFAFGISCDKNACKKTLLALEGEYGVAAGDLQTANQGFQWAYPNMWPPLVYWAYGALQTVGLQEDAKRIRGKYMQVVENVFKETGTLWEKYNVETGQVSNIEYTSPSMMGWTAGVYTYLLYNED